VTSRIASIAIAAYLGVGFCACTVTIGGGKAPAAPKEPAAPAEPAIPESSPLSQIRKGMAKKDVVNLLGLPQLRTNLSADAGMPSAFAPEMWSYRGLGRVFFSGADPTTADVPLVGMVEYDPTEQAEPPPPPPPYGKSD
jgi:hypothetical protein